MLYGNLTWPEYQIHNLFAYMSLRTDIALWESQVESCILYIRKPNCRKVERACLSLNCRAGIGGQVAPAPGWAPAFISPWNTQETTAGLGAERLLRVPSARAPPTALRTCLCHAHRHFWKPVCLSPTGRTLALEAAPSVYASPGRSLTGKASQPRFCWNQAPAATSASWRRPPSFN